MEMRWITPLELQQLDPYGNNSRTVKRFRDVTKSFFEPPSRFISLNPDEMFGRYQDMLNNFRATTNGRHEVYFEYNQEMYSKYSPQGGMYEWDKMLEILQQSYDLAHRPITVTDVLARGRDYLIARITELVRVKGYPQYQPLKFYNTFAGIPTGLKKGTYQAETEGMTPGFRHLLPDILGQRRMRGKDRLIHQDSVVNVRYVEPTLTACRNWLKRYLPEYFNGWLKPDLYLTPSLTKMIDNTSGFVSIETDYNAMDLHFQREVVEAVVLPIYEALLPEGDFLHLAHYAYEAFEQPVFAGQEMIIGLHTLFSGQGITNDFETLFSVALALGGVLTWNPYRLADTLITANGDDIAVVLRKSKKDSIGVYENLMQTMIGASESAGLAMSKEKCRLDDQSVRFCRKVYYRRGRRDDNGYLLGAYPSILALNNIVQPERPLLNPGYATIADLQRMDNVAGSPEYTQFVHLVNRYRKGKMSFTDEDLRNHPVDWWERVYGEKWDPESSPSFRLLCKI